MTYLKANKYSEPSERFKIECFAKIVKSYNYFPKHSILDLWQGSEYTHLSITTH